MSDIFDPEMSKQINFIKSKLNDEFKKNIENVGIVNELRLKSEYKTIVNKLETMKLYIEQKLIIFLYLIFDDENYLSILINNGFINYALKNGSIRLINIEKDNSLSNIKFEIIKIDGTMLLYGDIIVKDSTLDIDFCDSINDYIFDYNNEYFYDLIDEDIVEAFDYVSELSLQSEIFVLFIDEINNIIGEDPIDTYTNKIKRYPFIIKL
jgi:hypothetical protein